MKHVISIGPTCLVSILGRQCSVRGAAYPFDWKANTTIREVIEIIKNRNNFDVSKWFNNNRHDLPHDKPGDLHGIAENNYENVDYTEKYKKRFERFFKYCNTIDTIFVRFNPRGYKSPINITDTKEDFDELQKLCPLSTIVNIDDTRDENSVKDQLIKYCGHDPCTVFFTYMYFASILMTFPCDTVDIKKFCFELPNKIYGIGDIPIDYINEYLIDSNHESGQIFLKTIMSKVPIPITYAI